MPNRHIRVMVGIGVGTLAAVALGVSYAGAGAPDPGEIPINVEPSTAAPGDIVVVSGTDCFPYEGGDDHFVDMFLLDGETAIAEAVAEANDEGDWQDQMTVPEDITEDTTLAVVAICRGLGESFALAALEIVVPTPPTVVTTTTTTTTTPTTPTTTPTPTAPAPVVRVPTVTG